METKPQRKKFLFPRKTQLAIQAFMSSPETQRMLNDPKAAEALRVSTARVRAIAEKRRKAREISLELRLAPCTI